jgi:hypothetical protein
MPSLFACARTGRLHLPRLGTLVVAALLAGTEARAQSAGEALRTVVFNGVLTPNSGGTLYGLLLGETTTFPIGSSAGGFTWLFDAKLRVPVRRTQSFGPMFAERPYTTGKGKMNLGVSFQHTTFASVGGQPLSALEDSVTYGSDQFYRYNSSLELALDRTIVSATVGVHDRLDLGVIVPLGQARVSGFASYSELLEGQENNSRTDASGSSAGVGDVVIRAKAALPAFKRFDAAATLDLRLPTGDPEKLLGTGHAQTRVMFVASSTWGTVAPHVNVGYTFGGDGMKFGPDNRWEGSSGVPELLQRSPSEEFNYTVGADIVVRPALTVSGDVIGRLVQDTAGIRQFDSGTGGSARVVFLEFTPGTTNLMLGAVGAKVSVGRTWLLTGTVLFPLRDNGLKPAVTPVFGFEKAF